MTQQVSPHYTGRFAPSPTGPLHIGSLLTAVASYVDAKANQGTWLVRMEDLDPPREVPGAAEQILDTLLHYGLQWDDKVWFQSKRHQYYQDAISALLSNGRAYYCTCSRSQIRAAAGSNLYPGTCRRQTNTPNQPHAVRLLVDDTPIQFDDLLQGRQTANLQQGSGDFIINRKDGLYAYHLAVVLDDAVQGITHVVRGTDLLESTFCHIHLQNALRLPHPHYTHIPVIVNKQGQKLSKQTYAQAIPKQNPAPYLLHCLQLLGQAPPQSLKNASAQDILQWATQHWQLEKTPHCRSLNDIPLQ